MKVEQEKFTETSTQYLNKLNDQGEQQRGQSLDVATGVFFGVENVPEHKQVKQFAEPIPGYSGVNRRVQADNVFGMTY